MSIKTRVLFIALVCCNFFYAQNKPGIDFNSQYRPETRYRQTLTQSLTLKMKYSGNREAMQALKNKGIKNPSVSNKITYTEAVITCEKANEEKNFLMVIEFIKNDGAGEEKQIPEGTKIYGHCKINAQPVMDSVVSEEMSKQFKRKFLESMRNVLGQYQLPQKKLKVGESFTVDSPVSLPLPGLALELSISTRYTLNKIEGDNAYFFLTMIYGIKGDSGKYKLVASGSGKGAMIYDIKNQITVRYDANTQLNMKINIDGLKLKTKTNTAILQTVEINNQ